MSLYTEDDIQKLRKETGYGMMECKKALHASKGDYNEAKEWLENPNRLSLMLVNKRSYYGEGSNE